MIRLELLTSSIFSNRRLGEMHTPRRIECVPNLPRCNGSIINNGLRASLIKEAGGEIDYDTFLLDEANRAGWRLLTTWGPACPRCVGLITRGAHADEVRPLLASDVEYYESYGYGWAPFCWSCGCVFECQLDTLASALTGLTNDAWRAIPIVYGCVSCQGCIRSISNHDGMWELYGQVLRIRRDEGWHFSIEDDVVNEWMSRAETDQCR